MEKESLFQTYKPDELRNEPLRVLRDLYAQEAGSFLPCFDPRLSRMLTDQRIAEAESKFIGLFQEAGEKIDHPAIGRVLEIAQSEKWTRDNAQDLLGKVRSELWEDPQ